MRKTITFSIAALSALATSAQLPVSTSPQNKKALIEEFTGIHCTYCPDGHKISAQIVAANPGNAFAVNVHTGSYATPSGAELDFRTSEGDAIAAISTMGITGYPTGDVNRHIFSGTTLSMSRSDWAASVATILGQSAYVNIAGEASLDINTNVMTINIQAYYTANSPQATNKLTVMLVQNNVNGTQTGAASYNPTMVNPDGTYRHMHALRDVISATTGDAISPTTAGTTINKSYTYTVPGIIRNIPVDVSNLELIAFVGESTNAEIINVGTLPITYTGITTTNNGAASSLVVENNICQTSTIPSFLLKNKGSATMTSAAISYSVNGGTAQIYNWTGSLTSLASTTITLPVINFTLNASNTINLSVQSINGGTDQDVSDNTATATFIETTTLVTSGTITINVTQDQYGTETSWSLFDVSGSVITSGGPYANLTASGVLLHTSTATLPSDGCYRFEIYDSYGDGINSGFVAGTVELKNASGTTFYSLSGAAANFGSKGVRNFKKGPTSILENEFVNNVNIYPNPVSTNATISFNLIESNEVIIEVVNAIGQIVSTKNLGKVSAGEQNYSMDASTLNNGFYFVNIRVGNSNVVKKISINK